MQEKIQAGPILPMTQKKSIWDKIFLILVILLIIAEIYGFFITSLSFASEKVTGQWEGIGAFMFYVTILVPIGIAGVIVSIIGLIKAIRKKQRGLIILGIGLFVLSIFTVNFLVYLDTARAVHPLFLSYVRNKKDKSFEKKQERYEQGQKDHYDFFMQIFQMPMKVTDVKCSELLLDGKYTFAVINNNLLNQAQSDRLQNYLEKNVKGKTVKVQLPDFETFKIQYIPNMLEWCWRDLPRITVKVDEVNVKLEPAGP
jgi:uncharacterized membrane protein